MKGGTIVKGKYFICIIVGILLVAMYAIGYNMALGWETEIVENHWDYTQVNSNSQVILKRTSQYVLEIYNNETGDSDVVEDTVPVEFIGLDREEIIEFISGNTDFFKDEGEKIKNVMLVSFGEKRVVIRKTIELEEEETTYNFNLASDEPNYYIFLIDNTVVVYKSDKTTVYMETGITRDELDEQVAAELSIGVSVKNISELYRLLESYTS